MSMNATNMLFLDDGESARGFISRIVLKEYGAANAEEYAEATDGDSLDDAVENRIGEIAAAVCEALNKLGHLVCIELGGSRDVHIDYPFAILDKIGRYDMTRVDVEGGRLVVTSPKGSFELLGLSRKGESAYRPLQDPASTNTLYDAAERYANGGEPDWRLFVPLWPILASEVDSPFLDGSK